MKTKNTKTTKSKKTAKDAPDYISKNGVTYEKVYGETVALDLKEDIIQHLDNLVDEGKFVSRGDALRSILREYIEQIK